MNTRRAGAVTHGESGLCSPLPAPTSPASSQDDTKGLGVARDRGGRAGEGGQSGPSFKGNVPPLCDEKALPEGNHPQSDKASLKGGSPPLHLVFEADP